MVASIKEPMTGDKYIDALFKMNTELISELWILIDRVAVLEHALEASGALQRGAVDDSRLSNEIADEMDKRRKAFVNRIIEKPWREEITVDSARP